MHPRNLPTIDARYWTAIVAASMCGANTGDFASRILHLGHTKGLLPFALIFALIVWAERHAKRTTELYYWMAIIVVRTAATNLADLGTHDLKLGYVPVELGLAGLMTAMLLMTGESQRSVRREWRDLPAADTVYWIVMLAAGTLGTALGDWVAGELKLGLGFGSVALAAILGGILLIATRYGHMTKPWYWLSIVAARTLGTTLGDFLASRRGLNLGLWVSTLCTSLLLISILVLWKSRTAARSVTVR